MVVEKQTFEQYIHGEEPRIKQCTMSTAMKEDVVRYAKEALLKTDLEKEIAKHLKEQMDKHHKMWWKDEKESAPWQCIVGDYFGSMVSPRKGDFIMFWLDDLAFIVFRSK